MWYPWSTAGTNLLAKLLDSPEHIVHNLAQEASRRGWLTYQAVDNIVEINFSILLKQSGDH